MKIEVLHPIAHEKKEYSRGIHDLPDELAKFFLGLKDAVTGKPIARKPVKEEAPEGTVEDNRALKEKSADKAKGKEKEN